jgi:hypothetical protein
MENPEDPEEPEEPEESEDNMDNPILRMDSVRMFEQTKSTCYAHATSRCLVRTLQILAVIPQNATIQGNEIQFAILFYKLFFKIVTAEFDCDGNNSGIAIPYLIDYLVQHLKGNPAKNIYNIKNDSGGTKRIIECDEETCHTSGSNEFEPILKIFLHEKCVNIKATFESRLKAVLPKLLIIKEEYKITLRKNYPSPLMIDTLRKGLQPIISFFISNNNKYGDLATKIGECIPDGGHAIILKQWRKSCIVIKNTWNVNSIDIAPNEFNEVNIDPEQLPPSKLNKTCAELRLYGDTTLKNINQLSCIDCTTKYSNIVFYFITYDEELLHHLSRRHKRDIISIKENLIENIDYEIPDKFNQKSTYSSIGKLVQNTEEMTLYKNSIVSFLIKLNAVNYLYYCYCKYNSSALSPNNSNLLISNETFLSGRISEIDFTQTDEFSYTPLHYIVESLINNTDLFEDFYHFITYVNTNTRELNLLFSNLKPILSNQYLKNPDISDIPFTYSGTIQSRLNDYFRKLKNYKENFFYKLIPKKGVLSLWGGGKQTLRKVNKNKTKNKRSI